MPAVLLALNSSLLKSAAQSESLTSSFLPSHTSSPNQLNKDLAQRNTGSTQPTKNERDVDKEIEGGERNLEREAKQSCEISGDRFSRKSKKCEPSIYEQAYPGVDFQAQDKEITDRLIRELQKDSRFQNRTIVK